MRRGAGPAIRALFAVRAVVERGVGGAPPKVVWSPHAQTPVTAGKSTSLSPLAAGAEKARAAAAPTLADVREYVERLYRETQQPECPEKAHVAKMKKYLNFVGQGVDADAAFLHDMGRCIIPTEWTSDPAPLTLFERAVVHQHPAWSYLLLSATGWTMLSSTRTTGATSASRPTTA